jgi:hypothetical protein
MHRGSNVSLWLILQWVAWAGGGVCTVCCLSCCCSSPLLWWFAMIGGFCIRFLFVGFGDDGMGPSPIIMLTCCEL